MTQHERSDTSPHTHERRADPKGWFIDRKFLIGTISVALAIVVHAITLTSFIVRMDARLVAVEHNDVKQEVRIEEIIKTGHAHMSEMNRMGIVLESVKSDVGWIRENLVKIKPRRD